MINWIKNLSVRTKLIIILVWAGIIPALFVFSVFMSQEKTFKHDYSEHYASAASGVLDIIDRNLFERYGDVQAFGLNTAAYDPANWKNPSADNPLIETMDKYVKAYGVYPVMMLVSPSGELLAVNTKDAAGKTLDTAGLYADNFSDEVWFKDALAGKFLEGKNGLTGSVMLPPERNRIVGKVYGNDGFVIPFSAPVHDHNKQLVGVWVNFASFTLVERIIGERREEMLKAGMTDPDLMIFDEKGTQLVDYDPQNLNEKGELKHDFENIILKKNFIEMGVEAAKLAAEGKEGFTTEINPDSQEMNMFSYKKSKGVADFPGTGWLIRTMSLTL